ncbi:hypothetical protein ACKKBG_A04655 [Auxenochlorella protothecoides x Auxenochlorella symbiontica]
MWRAPPRQADSPLGYAGSRGAKQADIDHLKPLLQALQQWNGLSAGPGLDAHFPGSPSHPAGAVFPGSSARRVGPPELLDLQELPALIKAHLDVERSMDAGLRPVTADVVGKCAQAVSLWAQLQMLTRQGLMHALANSEAAMPGLAQALISSLDIAMPGAKERAPPRAPQLAPAPPAPAPPEGADPAQLLELLLRRGHDILPASPVRPHPGPIAHPSHAKPHAGPAIVSLGQDAGRKRARRSEGSRTCSNCGVTATPFWRKSRASGLPLCNACGLYSAKNGDAHRPPKLWREGQPVPPGVGDDARGSPAAVVGAQDGRGAFHSTARAPAPSGPEAASPPGSSCASPRGPDPRPTAAEEGCSEAGKSASSSLCTQETEVAPRASALDGLVAALMGPIPVAAPC